MLRDGCRFIQDSPGPKGRPSRPDPHQKRGCWCRPLSRTWRAVLENPIVAALSLAEPAVRGLPKMAKQRWKASVPDTRLAGSDGRRLESRWRAALLADGWAACLPATGLAFLSDIIQTLPVDRATVHETRTLGAWACGMHAGVYPDQNSPHRDAENPIHAGNADDASATRKYALWKKARLSDPEILRKLFMTAPTLAGI